MRGREGSYNVRHHDPDRARDRAQHRPEDPARLAPQGAHPRRGQEKHRVGNRRRYGRTGSRTIRQEGRVTPQMGPVKTGSIFFVGPGHIAQTVLAAIWTDKSCRHATSSSSSTSASTSAGGLTTGRGTDPKEMLTVVGWTSPFGLCLPVSSNARRAA